MVTTFSVYSDMYQFVLSRAITVSMLEVCFVAKKLHGAHNSWHCRWWTLMFVFYLISTMVVFFIPSDLMELYGFLHRTGEAGVKSRSNHQRGNVGRVVSCPERKLV